MKKTITKILDKVAAIHEELGDYISELEEKDTDSKEELDKVCAIMNILRDASTCLGEAEEFLEKAEERA